MSENFSAEAMRAARRLQRDELHNTVEEMAEIIDREFAPIRTKAAERDSAGRAFQMAQSDLDSAHAEWDHLLASNAALQAALQEVWPQLRECASANCGAEGHQDCPYGTARRALASDDPGKDYREAAQELLSTLVEILDCRYVDEQIPRQEYEATVEKARRAGIGQGGK